MSRAIDESPTHENDLEEVLERMRQLVHDMRNPIGTVGLAVELLSGPFAEALQRLPGPARDHIGRTLLALGESAQQLRHLVSDLEALGVRSRTFGSQSGAQTAHRATPITSAAPCAKPSRLRLTELLGRLEILTVTRSALPALLAVECPEHLMLDVNGPELLRALSNLVENAIEASAEAAPGASPWTVSVRAREDGASVCIDVANRGGALAYEIQTWVAAPSSVGETPRSSKPDDDGLHGVGLPIVRRVAQTYDGELLARSDRGTTTMTLRFPAPAVEQPKAS
ncbi:MAG: HAMP domain-containing sensor histidine kinase [Nannocystaceae bacterium]